MGRAALVLLVAVLGLCAGVVAPQGARGQQGGFTSRERDLLGRGQLVARPREETRGDRVWVGGSSYQQVDRPRDEVWRGVHDVSHWRYMLPETAETRAEPGDDGTQLVGVRHSYGPIDARYTLRVQFDDPSHRATFEVEPGRPHDVRAAHGFIEVHPWPGDTTRSLIVWAVLADPGDNPLVAMLVGDIQYWSLRVPSTMRDYLQGDGASRYLE